MVFVGSCTMNACEFMRVSGVADSPTITVCGRPAITLAVHKYSNEVKPCCADCLDRAKRRGYEFGIEVEIKAK